MADLGRRREDKKRAQKTGDKDTSSGAEQVGVRAGALQDDLIIGELVDQQPVGCDVALARALPFTRQAVIAIALRELVTLAQERDDSFEAGPLVAALADPLEVSAEALRRAEVFHTSLVV